MTKAEALYKFFSSFGLTAYPTGAVPPKATYPYLTYENQIGSGGMESFPTLTIWYHTDSEAVLNDKADEITKRIGQGVSIPCDDGAIYVFLDEPWQGLSEDNDNSIKRRFTSLKMAFNAF